MSFFRRLTLFWIVAILLACTLALLLGYYALYLRNSSGSVVNVEIVDISHEILPLSVIAIMDEIDEVSRTRREVTKTTAKICNEGSCRISIPFDRDHIIKRNRFVVHAEASGRGDTHYSSRQDQFVLTYGFPSNATIELVSDSTSELIDIKKYIESLIDDYVRSSVRPVNTEIRTSKLSTNDLYKGFFREGKLVLIVESVFLENQNYQYFYFVRNSSLAAVYRSDSADPLRAALRIYLTRKSQKVVRDEYDPEHGSSKAETDQELISHFAALAETLASSNAKELSDSLSTHRRIGLYTFGTGLNVLQDCEAGSNWWVRGAPAIIVRLQRMALSGNGQGRGTLLISYDGSFLPDGRSLANGKRIDGDLWLSGFEVENLPNGSGCYVTR